MVLVKFIGKSEKRLTATMTALSSRATIAIRQSLDTAVQDPNLHRGPGFDMVRYGRKG